MNKPPFEPSVSKTPGATVTKIEPGGWHLEIPAGTRRSYYLAQLDDHNRGRRSSYRWKPPLTLSLKARVSAQGLAGTWGFGLWNEPFSFLFGYAGAAWRVPDLPQAAWFFHASPENYLSLRDDLPANGLLAATFHSKNVPALILMLASPLMALSLIPGAAQRLREGLRRLIQQDTALTGSDPTGWHAYRMEWEASQVRFFVDEVDVLRTDIAPRPPLSLVMWIDNQFAALPPRGGLKYGYLANPEPAWMEICEFKMGKHV